MGGELPLSVQVGSSDSASTHTNTHTHPPHNIFPFLLRHRLLPLLRQILAYSHACSRHSHLLGQENLCIYMLGNATSVVSFVTLVVISCMAQLQRRASRVVTSAMRLWGSWNRPRVENLHTSFLSTSEAYLNQVKPLETLESRLLARRLV